MEVASEDDNNPDQADEGSHETAQNKEHYPSTPPTTEDDSEDQYTPLNQRSPLTPRESQDDNPLGDLDVMERATRRDMEAMGFPPEDRGERN